MQFSEIVGQQHIKTQLSQLWQNGHFPHAILINGKEGTGGLAMAIATAQYILCLQKNEDDSCGHCSNCQKISKLQHPDVHFSFPSINSSDSKKALSDNYIKDFRTFFLQHPYGTTFQWLQTLNAGNKQGNITAEECRQIIEKISLKSYEGKEKVLIMWRPEYMGKEGNILLKLIEEPPAHTHFILVSQQLDEILTTIQSRTQLVKLPPINEVDLQKQLIKDGIEPDRAKHIAFLSSGSYSEAIQLCEQVENNLFPELRQWFNMLFTNNGIGISKFTDELAKQGREQQRNFLSYVINILEATLKQRYLGHTRLSQEELSFVQKLAAQEQISATAISTIISDITKTAYYIQRNANSKIQLHTLSLKILYAIQNKKVSSLIN